MKVSGSAKVFGHIQDTTLLSNNIGLTSRTMQHNIGEKRQECELMQQIDDGTMTARLLESIVNNPFLLRSNSVKGEGGKGVKVGIPEGKEQEFTITPLERVAIPEIVKYKCLQKKHHRERRDRIKQNAKLGFLGACKKLRGGKHIEESQEHHRKQSLSHSYSSELEQFSMAIREEHFRIPDTGKELLKKIKNKVRYQMFPEEVKREKRIRKLIHVKDMLGVGARESVAIDMQRRINRKNSAVTDLTMINKLITQYRPSYLRMSEMPPINGPQGGPRHRQSMANANRAGVASREGTNIPSLKEAVGFKVGINRYKSNPHTGNQRKTVLTDTLPNKRVTHLNPYEKSRESMKRAQTDYSDFCKTMLQINETFAHNKGESGDKEQLKAVMKLKPWGGKDSDSIFSFKKYEDLNLNELQNKKNNLTQKTEDLNTDFYSRIQNLESWLDKNPTGITKAMEKKRKLRRIKPKSPRSPRKIKL